MKQYKTDPDSDDDDSSSKSEEEELSSDEEEESSPKAGTSGVKKTAANPFYSDTKRAKLDTASDESSEFDSGGDSDDDEEDDDEDQNEEDGEQEDALIAALKQSKEKKERNCPPDIKLYEDKQGDGNFTDLSFHPKKNILAVSTITGQTFLYEYDNEVNKLLHESTIHKGSVRSIEFDCDGGHLYSGGKDKSFQITDVETNQVIFKGDKSHDSPLYKVKPLTQHLLATGDEDGTVKLWDSRHSSRKEPVMEEKQFEDAVTDIFFDPLVDEKLMVATSAEGTLLSFNLAGKKPDTQSEVYEGELNAMACVHRNSKLVVGCGDGRLYMFHWKQFGYHGADFPGHPDAINAMVAATDNVVITACEDGTIRAVHLYPHRFVGTVGHHDHNYPVERLDISTSGDVIASISHDQKVKFWNIQFLEEMDYNKTRKPFLQQRGKQRRKENRMQLAKEAEHQLPSSNRGNKKDFFKDLEDDEA